jgi:hypothetical protein
MFTAITPLLRIYWADILNVYFTFRRWVIAEIAKGNLEERISFVNTIMKQFVNASALLRSYALNLFPGIGWLLRILIDYLLDYGLEKFIEYTRNKIEVHEIMEDDPVLMAMCGMLILFDAAQPWELSLLLDLELNDMIATYS